MLDSLAAKEFYDRFGARQDRQAFYEDAALETLFSHADFGVASAIAEFGCGTGRFAQRILRAAPAATYVGFDISSTMLGLTRQRLGPFGARASAEQLAPGTVTLPLAAGSVDRLVSTYVLDLLPNEQIAAFLSEAERVLAPSGYLCLVSLTPGSRILPRVVSGLWMLAFRLHPATVGGCRPIRLAPFCADGAWQMRYHQTLVRWSITSEVLVATRPSI
jgi:ubiquinone/menaquinone biosynthesis C-methylase UbiE